MEIQGKVATSPDSSLSIVSSLLWKATDDDETLRLPTNEEARILSLHRERILATAATLSWTSVAHVFGGESGHKHFQDLLIGKITNALEHSTTKSRAWKVRLLVGKQGKMQVEIGPITLHPVEGISEWPSLPEKLDRKCVRNKVSQVYVDTQPISPSPFTKHKTTYRKHYDDARRRRNIQNLGPTDSEILLYNENLEVMDASICTVYFWRNEQWVTPLLCSGGNAGVSRRMAIEAGLCVESLVHLNELLDGEVIWLSNAVRGFMLGRVCLSKQT